MQKFFITVKLVIRGHSTIHRQVSTVDKVSMYERLQLFTQFINFATVSNVFSHSFMLPDVLFEMCGSQY